MKRDVSECRWYRVCPMKRYYEQGVLAARWVNDYCRGDWGRCIRYQMEEAGRPHPDWMRPDGQLDETLREADMYD
jgi:hypothetical protein